MAPPESPAQNDPAPKNEQQQSWKFLRTSCKYLQRHSENLRDSSGQITDQRNQSFIGGILTTSNAILEAQKSLRNQHNEHKDLIESLSAENEQLIAENEEHRQELHEQATQDRQSKELVAEKEALASENKKLRGIIVNHDSESIQNDIKVVKLQVRVAELEKELLEQKMAQKMATDNMKATVKTKLAEASRDVMRAFDPEDDSKTSAVAVSSKKNNTDSREALAGFVRLKNHINSTRASSGCPTISDEQWQALYDKAEEAYERAMGNPTLLKQELEKGELDE